ncbi:hypothetical protein [Treponema sp.]|uniref:hypothetical protein n=1 Tax=Treponema sp. TaxID=166 RepID=UPI00388D5127
MKFDIKNIVAIVISVLVFVLLLAFKTVPLTQLWKGYQILYVYSQDLKENDILAVLSKYGCTDVISKSSQRLPVLSSISPVQFQTDDSYIAKRNAFFTDKSSSAMVFYVNENQSSYLDKAIPELNSFSLTKAGTDGKASFPWIAPILLCMFWAVLFFFSKNRPLFAAASFFSIVFAFSRPLYSVSAGISLFIFALFLFHRLWKRKDFLKAALNSPYIILFTFFPPLVLVFVSPADSVFYLLSVTATVSSVYLYSFYEEKQDEKSVFKPVFIRSAKMFPVIGHLGIRLIGLLIITLVLISVSLNFSGKLNNLSDSTVKPALPSPVSSSDSSIVNLTDFMYWAWNTASFPYKKIENAAFEIPEENQQVQIKDYSADSNGKIVVSDSTALVYNSKFRESVYSTIEQLNYPALEKLMLKQGKNTAYGYSKGQSQSSSEKFVFAALLILITVPLCLGAYYIIGRKRYGLSI